MSTIRFVEGARSLISWDIEARENVAMPITPSHTEMLSRDGKSYIGAHIDGGIAARPIGYDAATMKAELLIDLGADGDEAAFAYIESKIGEPYDWAAILDFLLPVNLHQQKHVICSAFMHLALRKKQYFPWPLPWPAHMTSPRDLLGLIGARQHIPGL